MSWDDTHDVGGLENLVGHKVIRVDMDEDNLTFFTDADLQLDFSVEGDCCSYSYFHDMVGTEKLIKNGPVISVGNISLDFEGNNPGDDHDDVVQVYGFEIVTESETWGEQTTVFSFRNSSNGYYGGWMNFDGIKAVVELPTLGFPLGSTP